MAQHFTLQEIVASLGGQVDIGTHTDAATLKVFRLASLAQAQSGAIAFF